MTPMTAALRDYLDVADLAYSLTYLEEDGTFVHYVNRRGYTNEGFDMIIEDSKKVADETIEDMTTERGPVREPTDVELTLIQVSCGLMAMEGTRYFLVMPHQDGNLYHLKN